MKIGLSTYSLYRVIHSREMNVLEAIDWVADNGGEHVEISPFGFDLENDPHLVESIRRKAEEAGIEISNYAIGSNFIKGSEEEYQAEIQRIRRHVDIAHRLGVKRMRHDVAFRPPKECGIVQFESDLPPLVEACRQIADYAEPHGITTSVENHGYYIQASDRVLRLIAAVNRANFQTTLDVGNFLCVDENPVTAVQKNISFASIVHLKDFYIRPSYLDPGEGWFATSSGNHLRGAIVGQGDIDMREVLRTIRKSGFDGYAAIEFEGLEDSKTGSRMGIENAKRLWAEVS